MTRRLTTILAIAIGTVLCAGIAAWAFFTATANASQQIASGTLGAATSASATATGSTSIAVSVNTGPTTPGATGYTVRPGGSTSSTACTITGATGTCSATGLTAGTAYTFDIYSTLGNWISSTSKSVSATTLKVTTTTLPAGIVGTPYSTSLAATGGSGTYSSWSVSSGTLPSWATLNTSTGAITGTPDTAATTSGLVFTVTDSNGGTAQSGSLSLVVSKGNQTITFGTITSKTFDQGPLTLSATASSGLAVTFSSTTTSVCTVSGTTVAFVTTGTCTIKADQAGNANYNAAPQASQSFTISKGSQTVTFGTIATKTFDQGPITVSATASSGLAVTFSSTTIPVCTVSGTTVTFVTIGTCTIKADQAGSANYNAAPQASQSFTISKGNQTITFGALADKRLDQGPITVSATASSGASVSFSSTTTGVCTSTGTNGTTINFISAGTCTIKADQAGNASYNAAPQVSQSLSITQGNQTISFAAFTSKRMDQGPVTASATASSGLAVAFTSATPTVCTATGSNGSNINLLTVGTCTIAADQAGDSNWNSAPQVQQSFTITKGNQTITFGTLAGKTFDQSPITVSATASSGLAVAFTSATTPVCTVSGSTVTFVTAGSCTINANQAGDSNWNSATQVQQSFAIGKANQTITFGSLPSKTFDQGPTTVSATASSGLAVAFTSATAPVCTVSGSTVTFVTAGTCTINANQAGNGGYNAATQVQQSFTISKASQTITFGSLASKTFDQSPITVGATASSGLAVVFTSATAPVCTVSGSTVTFVTPGTCTINANQAGNGGYNAATQVQQSFAIAKGSQTISFTSTNPSPDGGGDTYTPTATATSGLTVAITLDGTSTGCTLSSGVVTFTTAGTCVVDANQAGNGNWNAAPQVQQTITVHAGPTVSSPTSASPCNPGHNNTANCSITGTGFVNGVTVSISSGGGVNSVTFNSSTSLTINVTGSGGNGAKGNIIVTNPDGGTVTVTNGFSNG